MADKKKNTREKAGSISQKTGVITHPVLDYSGHKDEQENEPWLKWKVRPDLVPMPETQPESGIGKRIAYCRGQLNNLSVEALARYTKYFDQVGISKASIVRYEGGDSFPGARELRILCDALWITPNWLLLGAIDSNSLDAETAKFVDATKLFVLGLLAEHHFATIAFDPMGAQQRAEKEIAQRPQKEKEETERRQKWIDEARKPSSQ